MDSLTGFLDRTACMREIERLASLARENESPLCVLWIGLDRFRQINTSFGHEAGDTVLAMLAHRLKTQLDPSAVLGRIGGDEFIVILPGTPMPGAEIVADRIRCLLQAPLEVGQLALRQACSIGLALLEAQERPQIVLERADRAMHDAKRTGGNQTVVASETRLTGRFGTELAREELVIEERLHEALETGGLSLHYQPILNVADGRLEACEALMRCTSRGQSIVPGQFIPVAEKTGLIVRLGEWTMLTAARLVDHLMQTGRPTKIAVNVSRAQLTAPKFRQVLYGVLACSEVPPGLIELELTESLFMDTSDTVRHNLATAVEAGFPLAIDDFGTGYSCLAYLKDLPASKLKLDRAFVKDLPGDGKSFAIIRTITQLATDLGMTVVAEGVETEAQRDTLAAAGVTALQGFLLSHPLPESKLEHWLATHS